jgi:hypothetical protein
MGLRAAVTAVLLVTCWLNCPAAWTSLHQRVLGTSSGPTALRSGVLLSPSGLPLLRCRGGTIGGGFSVDQAEQQARRAAEKIMLDKEREYIKEVQGKVRMQLEAENGEIPEDEELEPMLKVDPSTLLDDERRAHEHRRSKKATGDLPVGPDSEAGEPVVLGPDGRADGLGFGDILASSDEDEDGAERDSRRHMLDEEFGDGGWSEEYIGDELVTPAAPARGAAPAGIAPGTVR